MKKFMLRMSLIWLLVFGALSVLGCPGGVPAGLAHVAAALYMAKSAICYMLDNQHQSV